MLFPDETELIGQWSGQSIVADEVCQRIDKLIKTYLVLVANSFDGWSSLFQDPDDFRLWELIYPQSDLHGGGPPILKCIGAGDAQIKYGWSK